VPESPPSDAITFTRRTTVAALPLIALAGCRWGPEDDAPEEVEQAKDADADLVKTATQAIDNMAATVTVVADQHIGLAVALAPLNTMHAAHLQLLSPSAASAGLAPTLSEESSRAAMARVRSEEARLQTQLADLATSAVSGTLARALASMSAAIAQHLAVLPEIASRGPA
jgi:hypothetical protein